MERVTPGRAWALHHVDAIRRIESAAAAVLPPHALMQRAGLAVARLALALSPHDPRFWIACGPGNNGGDGFEAAMHLKAWGCEPLVTCLGQEDRLPPDARASLARARGAGVSFVDAPPGHYGLAVDALFGIGSRRPLEGQADAWRRRMNAGAAAGAPVLAVDLPSGLDADTGTGEAVQARHTLTLLAIKPGLFTAGGRDAAGEVWVDDLGVAVQEPPTAALIAAPRGFDRPHSSHKGSWGDVAVLGGAPGMRGAALLAARAALHAGAGRVFVALLGDEADIGLDPLQPDLMFRDPDNLDLARMHVACGCGGGEAVRGVLPRVLQTAGSLVLDADALNAIAAAPSLQDLLRERARRTDQRTILTPHPLEAARLLETSAADVQRDRIDAAQRLASRFECVVVLKGSGTVVAAPGALPHINPTGNARLAIAGTGDVLAGMAAARLAAGDEALDAAMGAVYAHGALADAWPADRPLTAAALAQAQAPAPAQTAR